ncbi:precorrin-6A/cobalt-precorrin-6A reductase [Reinekea thalattae]|uniref:Precorrin-6A/cobalt-precorrin-6A reductase n=1 Tax=Reinekea thalattae TaxID=2593301 RepID=A0A5C8Z6C7_9GAMM|nr:precorrin-6A/cobalt-precorrin-6A reductase [Reinekea thalattae]TXR53655.1 precorrin-6A/cobalt-precorrin-6A reductase [Reinekea thalattae]
MSLLILGGTQDAKRLAQTLQDKQVPVIYSIAGKVRQPEITCPVVSGGFTQFGGLAKFITAKNIRAVLDVTHPFAEKMTATAATVTRQLLIPYWQYQRKPWQQTAADRWFFFDHVEQLITQLDGKKTPFVTVGQLSEQQLIRLTKQHDQVVYRTAIAADFQLPKNVHWIQAVGPFDEKNEQQIFTQYSVDALVTKQSGGRATEAKITVARERQLDVFLQRRPKLASADQCFSDDKECINAVLRLFDQKNKETL